MNVIGKYIRDNYPDPQAGMLTMLVSYLKRLEGIKIGPFEAGFRSRELDKLYKLEEIHRLLPHLKDVLARRRVIVLVDELDCGWDSSEDAKAFVSGLFQACVSINELHGNLRVYVSLRQELYDAILDLYEDAQKYRDLLETISWTEDSLLKLIAKRIRHSAQKYGHNPRALEQAGDTACWNAVLATPPSHPVNNSFRYMIDRTLHRPGEIIQFCTQTVETARERADTLDVIEILWSVGFLTAQPASLPAPRRDDGKTFLAAYQAPHLNLATVERFQVHPMFRSHLDITTRR